MRAMVAYDFQDGGFVLGSHLRPRRLSLCPELSLWLLGDEVDLNARVSELFTIDAAPYWAFCWGSGQALARYVLDHPERVAGLRVVDFGAGGGVAALAACLAGARSVVAVDIDASALRACQANAALNACTLEVARALPEEFDVLLASDVLYEVGNRALLRTLSAAGKHLLVSDPLRPGNPRLDCTPAAHFDVRTLPDVDYPCAHAVVYDLAPNSLSTSSSPTPP